MLHPQHCCNNLEDIKQALLFEIHRHNLQNFINSLRLIHSNYNNLMSKLLVLLLDLNIDIRQDSLSIKLSLQVNISLKHMHSQLKNLTYQDIVNQLGK